MTKQIFPFYFLLQERAKPILPPYTHPPHSLNPPIPHTPPAHPSAHSWLASKWYFVNVERDNIADKLQPRNINVSFNNNSNVPIDVIIFTFYNDHKFSVLNIVIIT